MREFIKGTGAFFVIVGMVVMVGGLALLGRGLGEASGEGVLAGMLGFFAVVAAGGSFAMFGGTAWLLASIDERLEAGERRRLREALARGEAPAPPEPAPEIGF